MTSYQVSIMWLVGLLPSYAFGLGGVATWTILMWLINEYQDVINPNRNGVRNSRKSKEGNKNHTVEELNYFDKHPGTYKGYWVDRYMMLSAGNKNDHHYEYYRCKECGHVIKILVWQEDKRKYGDEIQHWCRGCQRYSTLTKIPKKTYDYENKYYNNILALMKYTKNGNINDIYDMLQRYFESKNVSYGEKFRREIGACLPSGLRKYHTESDIAGIFDTHYDVKWGTKYIYFNASDIETENRFDDGIEEVEKLGFSELEETFIACMELKKYPFYSRIYVPRKMTVENYLKMKGQDLFLRFIDENGEYKPKDGYRVEDPKSIYLLQQIDAGVYEEGKYKG